MERPLELFAIVAGVAIIAILLLGPNPGSRRAQIVVGCGIGAASALAVATQQTDLIPDGLELPLAAAGLAATLIVATYIRLRARSR